jgi:hypothetical protein
MADPARGTEHANKRGVGGDTPAPTRRDGAGHSAIELLMVLTVLTVVSTVYLALHRPADIYSLEIAAQRLAAEIERVREQAVATEGEALLAVRPDGSYAARSGAAGTLSLTSTPAGEWEVLPDELAWGGGEATRDPFGGALAPLPTQVFCGADGRCNAPAPAAVYLIQSIREPHHVGAVTLSLDGSVHVWRWRKGDGTWHPESR